MKQRQGRPADSVIVLDFETSGLSPGLGDRAIEVGAVRVEAGRITGRFQSLMNPGIRISGFIEDYTGITNRMLRAAPSCRTVMAGLADFINDHDLVAHNAVFDRRYVPERSILVTITYIVVVFSIVAQGMTLGKLVKRIYPRVRGES